MGGLMRVEEAPGTVGAVVATTVAVCLTWVLCAMVVRGAGAEGVVSNAGRGAGLGVGEKQKSSLLGPVDTDSG